jgi:hypothetical protein
LLDEGGGLLGLEVIGSLLGSRQGICDQGSCFDLLLATSRTTAPAASTGPDKLSADAPAVG